MTAQTQIYTNLVISMICILIKIFWNGKKDPLTYLILFYFFFTFGPVINYLIGIPIYFGTPVEYIPQATNNFTLAIATMCFLGIAISHNTQKLKYNIQTSLSFSNFFFVLFPIYSILQSLYVLIFSFSGSKIDKIALLTPRLHYNYLLIEVYLVSLYFLIKNKKLYWLNLASYVFYCLVTGERDFIFPLVAIGIHILIFTEVSRKRKFLIFTSGISFFALGTLIFFLRDSSQVSNSVLGSILNQGSLLFINSFTIKLMNESYEFFNGFTYLNSIQNLLPSFIYKTDFNNLAWFKENYAPKSTSGYGFGLDAEGYMNFGYFGIVLTFSVITLLQRLIMRNFYNKDFFKYFSVFFTAFTMYSFRNDSLAFIKGNLYAIIFFGGIFVLSNFINQTKKKST